jgi:vancomycin resistance protein YoaR
LLAVPVLLMGVVAADYLVYTGRVHPGVEVAGLSLSGMSAEGATAALTRLAEEAKARPITFAYQGEAFQTTAGDLGWEPDVEATVLAALEATSTGSPFKDLWNRMRAWLRPVSVRWEADFGERWSAVVADWQATVAEQPVEGQISVNGTSITRSEPESGVEIDGQQVAALSEELIEDRRDGPLALPVVSVAPRTTTEDVDAAQAAAELLLDGPITARIGFMEVEFLPQDLAPLIRTTIEPVPLSPVAVEPGSTDPSSPVILPLTQEGETTEGEWRIQVSLDPSGVDELLQPYRRRVETEPKSASFVPVGESVRIRAAKPGRRIDSEVAARRIVSISRKTTRSGKIPMAPVEAQLTTEEAQKLGIRELVSSFTTYHACCEPRVDNIHLGADTLRGVILMPGETFSLNLWLGERTLDKGYVPAPGIFNGILVNTPGGGISQLTTTVFNAAFFGGYPISEWQAHSYYFSRYPLGREATLSWPNPDLKFTNDTDHALMIWTGYTDVSITVKIYSTKIRDVVATDPVITGRTEAGYFTLVERVVRVDGDVVRRDEFRTYYKNGVPLTEEEARQQEEEEQSPSPEPSPSPSPTPSPSG